MTLSGEARLAGVIGWPVGHSLSPRLHGHWLARHRIDGAYVPMAVHPQDLGPALKVLPKLGFAGVNVTVPHKETVLDLAHSADSAAQRIGAANTLLFTPEGAIEAHNTDGYGFIENLRQHLGGLAFATGPAVVLGAGGSARAVVDALLRAGVPEVRVANRTKARAQALAADLGGPVTVIEWAERATALAGASLLANTTTLGLRGQPPLDIDLAALPDDAVVTDIVYVPLETTLLADARRRGNPTVDGIGMLLHQARPGFRVWFGVEPEVTDELRRFVLDGLRT